MAGVIAGFMGGLSKGMADAGKMLLFDKLETERDDANFLRDSEFRKTERIAGEGYKTGAAKTLAKAKETETADLIKGRENVAKIGAKSRITAAGLSGGGTGTTNMRDAAALIAAGYPKDIANAIAHGGLKEIKDEDTGDMVLINALNNTPVGRLTTIGGKKQWLPEGELPENADVTAKHRKAAKIAANEQAGLFSLDSTDFPSTKGDKKQWIKDESQRLANEERGSKQTTPPGLVAGQAAGATKMVGRQKMTKDQFVNIMLEKFGKDRMAEIEETWKSIK